MFVWGCSPVPKSETPADDQVALYASIPPLAWLAEKVSGDPVEVVLAPGQNPHSYAPTSRQVAGLARARMLFTTGVPFETPLLERLHSVAPSLQVVDTTEGIPLREFQDGDDHEEHEQGEGRHEHDDHEGEEHHHHHHHEAKDPHVWMSPLLAIRQAEVVAGALKQAYPDRAEQFAQNFAQLKKELEALHHRLSEKLSPLKDKTLLVYHPAYGYLADAYGLHQKAVETGGKAPSAAQLEAFIREAKQSGAKVVFVQPQFPERPAQAVAEAIGGVVLPLDPLARDYMANLDAAATAIHNALAE